MPTGDDEFTYDPATACDDERAEITRTFSPPPRIRPYPLVISHQSEETLHHINGDIDIGSAGSSHSSGFNESLFDALESNSLSNSTFQPFDVDSPVVSEYNYHMREDDMKRSTSSVFEGIGGSDIVDGIDLKDQAQLIKSLTHRNKVLLNERRDLELQLEHQEDILDKMETDIQRIKREKAQIEKQKKEEGGRMRLENKELEYSLDKLRQQRLDAENKLELLEKERDGIRMQLEETRLQLQQAVEEHNRQREKNIELIKNLENKERQLSTLADDFKNDAEDSLATQYKIEDLMRENEEMRSFVQQLKTDREALAGNLTKATCELSRLQQGVPLSPTSSCTSSITSPISTYHILPPVFEAVEGSEALADVFNKQGDNTTAEILSHIEHPGSINIDDILDERDDLIHKNEMLEQELQDMKKLMYVVAPQHYIDDEALSYNNTALQYNGKPVEIAYECYGAHNNIQAVVTSQMRITPPLEEEEEFVVSPNTSSRTLAGIPDIPDREETRSGESLHSAESLRSGESLRSAASLHSAASHVMSDDADSGVLSQSSTDMGDQARSCDASCENCSLWQPEKELLLSKVVKTEMDLEHVKEQRNIYEQQLRQLQPSKWRGWLLHCAAFLILLFFLLGCLPLLSHQCKHNNHQSWTEFFSYKHIHLRDRRYQIPH